MRNSERVMDVSVAEMRAKTLAGAGPISDKIMNDTVAEMTSCSLSVEQMAVDTLQIVDGLNAGGRSSHALGFGRPVTR